MAEWISSFLYQELYTFSLLELLVLKIAVFVDYNIDTNVYCM